MTTSKRNRRLTAPEIAAEINRSRMNPVSVSTVKSRFNKAGLYGRITVKKPLLRPQNKKKRLEWAKQHRHCAISDWNKVLWSDESKFEIFGSKRRVFVRRSAEERVSDQCVASSIKHGGGSVMVWGCFGNNSLGDLKRIEEKLIKESYRSILQRHAIPSGKRIIGGNFVFQQDNDPKHTLKLCQNYLQQKKRAGELQIMVWPAQSPDLNPIELLWDELDQKVRKTCPTSQTDLWSKLLEEWQKITPEMLQKLIARMPRLCEEIIKKRGGHIDESAI